MKHELKAELFKLTCDLRVFESDIAYPSNTIMQVSVDSAGFSGNSSMDIDIKGFAAFTGDLLNLYHTFTGSARIEEPFGNQFIEFCGDRRGHISVKGHLNSLGAGGFSQDLRFENEFDQTFLSVFAHEVYETYKKYMQN